MNKLYYGDNLDILRKFIKDDSVDLCYIDPPFNSKRNYNQIYNNVGTEDRAQAQAFMDTWSWDDHAIECRDDVLANRNQVQTAQSIALITSFEKVLGKGSLYAYLVSMAVRIAEIRRVLKPTGSFYLHCDDVADSYLRLISDSLFCPGGGEFKNEIVWERTNAHNFRSKGWARSNDRILFYTKSADFTFNPQYTDYGPEQMKRFKKDSAGRWYKAENLTFSSANKTRQFEFRGTKPPANRSWGASLEQLEAWYQEGKILLKQDGTPRLDGLKIYLDETTGKPVGTNWTDIERIGNTSAERLGYPTQKPEALLERIIKASSNKGETILDAFCGCGTTLAVAEKLKRNWIGIDITYQSVSLILKRLKDTHGQEAIDNVELHGVPRDIEAVDALIHKKDDRVRKEFEKWAILTYSDNRAIINEKKGADKGIDGVAYTRKSKEDVLPVIISVKSGNIGRKEVGELRGTIERENAACGILITRNEPTKPMILEAKEAGQFKPEYHTAFDRLQIVTVQEILDGKRMNLPLMEEVTKKAKRITGKVEIQTNIFATLTPEIVEASDTEE
jgi:DNA modification methylase